MNPGTTSSGTDGSDTSASRHSSANATAQLPTNVVAFIRKLGTFSPRTSCTTWVSLDTLVVTSDTEPGLRSKYSMSCRSTARRYRARIREACRSAVRAQQYPSTKHNYIDHRYRSVTHQLVEN